MIKGKFNLEELFLFN